MRWIGRNASVIDAVNNTNKTVNANDDDDDDE
jgi:hypothetical protein